jgi:RNA recognition motif-containing protein
MMNEQAAPANSAQTQKIHIGNLAPASSEEGVRALFATHGEVASYERPVDAATKAPAAFAFVQMAPEAAAKAIAALNGQELDGQALRVSEARPARA